MTDALKAFGPKHILIVDDDPMVQEILGEHYQAHGYRVECAAEGAAALALMEKALPDIVLCDRVMPGVSGAKFLGEIRSRGDAWRKVVFVFVTALTDRRDRYAMLPLEPDGYIDKPVNLQRADQLLINILTARQTAVKTPLPGSQARGGTAEQADGRLFEASGRREIPEPAQRLHDQQSRKRRLVG